MNTRNHQLRWAAYARAGIALSMVSLAADAGLGSLVREQKTVVVDGVAETWRLQWEKPPTSACGAEDPSVSLTCPCSGFAYGEQGELALVRIRPGGATERLELGPFFIRDELPGDGVRPAVLQQWPPHPAGPGGDFNVGDNDANFIRDVARRGSTDVMRIADYDHDGTATEFLLQVGTLPCGKHQMVLVGISKTNPHLHVFSSAEKPKVPLVLGAWQWKMLLGSRGTVDTVGWSCGDHGSEYEWTDALSASDGLLHDLKTRRKCTQAEQEGAPFDSTPPQ